ncbi:MAG: hypothetical protein KU37_11055 [Sulfuricurvum sp. PC08-66]|nr:MAG: hypothetical protein KU37_11055 [Sulfuricurvum sp. PC08-66]
MNKWLVYGVAGGFSLLVMLFVVYFLIDINRVKPAPFAKQKDPIETNKTSDTTRDWRLALDERTMKENYFYPLTEISIEMPMLHDVHQKFQKRIRHFKLTTQALSQYHYFCLKQVLTQSAVKHKIERYYNEVGVLLYSNDAESLQTIVKDLALYGIESTLKEL